MIIISMRDGEVAARLKALSIKEEIFKLISLEITNFKENLA